MANVLPLATQVRIISALVEGCSIRATARMTDTHRDTVMRLGVRVGEACAELHDRLMRDLHVSTIELDEIWSYIGKKQKRVTVGDGPDKGDCYTFIALDANRKAILSFKTGQRNTATTVALVADLRERVLGRAQITSDGWKAYPDAVELAFGTDADFAVISKGYQTPDFEGNVRSQAGGVTFCEKRVVSGSPDPDRISTSYIERANLTVRMHSRRFTRRTNAFSKKLRNHRAAVALHAAWYNFVRVHQTLRVTPAMELGVSDSVWSMEELLLRALETEAPEPQSAPMPPSPKGSPAPRAPFLRVIEGGKAN